MRKTPILASLSLALAGAFGGHAFAVGIGFLIGAILCSLSLFAMPYSSALWMAASLLWKIGRAHV